MRLSYTPPPGWDFSTIGDLAQPEKGSIRIGPFGSALKKHEYSETGVRVLGIEDVYPNQFLSDRCKYIPDAKFYDLRQYEVSDGDVLVTNMGTVGRACVVPVGTERSIISSHLIKVSLNRSRADPNYLCWMLNYSPLVVAQIRAKSHGAIMAGFNSSLLKSLRIPLPPLAEQKRIAGILDAADALRAKRREALAQLDTLLQSTFLDMFGDPVTNPMGWEVRGLKETKSRVQIGPFGSLLHKEDYIVDGVPLVNPMHIVSGQIRIGNQQTVSEQKAATLKKYRLQTGDVVMGRRGEMGRCAIVSDTEAGMLCGTGSLFFRPDPDELSSLFLAATFSSESMKRLLERLSQGVTMANLNRKMIEGLKIALPPLDLQHRYATMVESVDQQRARQRAHHAELDTLFASLQSRAFRGDL